MIEISRDDLSNDPSQETTLEWTIWANEGIDSIQCNEPFNLKVAPLSINKHGVLLPTELSLGLIFPNPFNPVTTTRYALPTQSYMMLVVYNFMG